MFIFPYISDIVEVTNSSCPNDTFAEESFIKSPNYPMKYDTGIDCSWTLKAHPGKNIELTFVEFDVYGYAGYKCDNYDFLRIINVTNGKNDKIEDLCNVVNRPAKTKFLVGNEFELKFKTYYYSYKPNKGFKIGFKTAVTGTEMNYFV